MSSLSRSIMRGVVFENINKQQRSALYSSLAGAARRRAMKEVFTAIVKEKSEDHKKECKNNV